MSVSNAVNSNEFVLLFRRATSNSFASALSNRDSYSAAEVQNMAVMGLCSSEVSGTAPYLKENVVDR